MSKTQLQTNNTRLASLIDELRGKAAGGGGTSVGTRTVRIVGKSDGKVLPGLTGYFGIDGSGNDFGYIGYPDYSALDVTVENVACNSFFVVCVPPGKRADGVTGIVVEWRDVYCDGASKHVCDGNSGGSGYSDVFLIKGEPGGTTTITVDAYNDVGWG